MKQYHALLSVLLLFWLLASPAWAQNTHGVPNQLQEMQATISDLLQPGILPNQCSPAVPVSSLTIVAFSCKGYVQATPGSVPAVVYVSQPAQAITLPNVAGTYWLLLYLNTSDTVSGWTRISGSHYLYQLSANQPANPANGLIFAKVTVTSVVTAIDPLNVGKSVSRALGLKIGAEYATGGDGSPNNPWTGWDTKIDWTRNNQTYWFATGTYNFAAGINVTGSGVKMLCAGYENTVLQYTAATGIAINGSSSPGSFVEFELGFCQITPTDTTAIKRAINLVDFRQIYIHDVWVRSWYGGGGSIGMRSFGRDTSTFERMVLDADRPLVISPATIGTINMGMDTVTFRDMQYGQLNAAPSANPCIEIEDKAVVQRFHMEGFQAAIGCKHGFYWNSPSATFSSQGGVQINLDWEQNTDQTGYLLYINFGQPFGFAVQDLQITHLYGGAAGQGIYLKGIQDVATFENAWYIGYLGNTNLSGVPIKVDAQIGPGISVIGSIAGGSITGSVGQTCVVNTYSNCNAQGSGVVILTGTNSIANGTTVNPTNPLVAPFASCTKKPTTAVLANGTATCSGTITFSSSDVQGNSAFLGLDIRGSFLDGDRLANTGGLDPCDGSGGAATGSHNCILGLVKLESKNVGVGDTGRSAFYANNNVIAPFPNMSLMGQTLSFPSSGTPITTASSSGSLGANASVVPFLNVVDCPTGLSPCTGTFHLMRVRVTVFSDDSPTGSVHESGDFYVSPFTWTEYPNNVRCLSCSANMVANIPGSITNKFVVFHGIQALPNSFFSFQNGFSVTVRWMATVEIIY